MSRKIRWGLVVALGILMVMVCVTASAATYNWQTMPKKSKLATTVGFNDSLTITGQLPEDLTITSKKPKVCAVMNEGGAYTLVPLRAGTAKIELQSKSQKLKKTLTVTIKANKYANNKYNKIPGQVNFGIKAMTYDADGDLKCTIYIYNGLTRPIYGIEEMEVVLFDTRSGAELGDDYVSGAFAGGKSIKPKKAMFMDLYFEGILDGTKHYDLRSGHINIRGTIEPMLTR